MIGMLIMNVKIDVEIKRIIGDKSITYIIFHLHKVCVLVKSLLRFIRDGLKGGKINRLVLTLPISTFLDILDTSWH